MADVIDLTCMEEAEVVEVIDLTRSTERERSADARHRHTVFAEQRAEAANKGDRRLYDSRVCKCPVCFETFEELLDSEYDLMALPCGHVLCHRCLSRLGQRRFNSCPVCRIGFHRAHVLRLRI
ncbi:zinc finger, C3HC4 type [Trichuris suis]|nr:zinc finger, C3HC4 type [Trichuris suis]